VRTEALRFLIVGALNTAAGYGLYLLLLRVCPYAVAYTLTWVGGIVLAFVSHSLYVFRTPLRWRRLVPYPLVYLGQYLLGLLVLYVGVEVLGWSERIMPVVALAVTLPASYLMNRMVLVTKPDRQH
jgi:putative flippase GtrA